MYILGLSCYYHDAAAALLQDGVLVAAAEEERFTRIKHDYGFPSQAIDFCLRQAGLTSRDLDYVVFYEKPLQKLLFTEHHLSHAASAFFCSPYDEAAILTIDGVGEWTTTTVGKATADWDGRGKNHIELFNELKFPHSLGLLYSAFTAFLGFQVNEGEYKVMGMAPYGKPTRVDDVYKLVEMGNDASFRLNMDYFSFHHSTSRTFNNKFVKLFGAPRAHESVFYTPTTHPKKDHPNWDTKTAETNQYYADISASIQTVTEEMLLKMARYAYERTGLKRLCMAGGVALNSVANGRILRETPFEEVWIQPAAGDSGGALGAALYVY